MSLRAKRRGSPKPALLTSMSIGRSGSDSRCTTRSSSLRNEQVGGEHLDRRRRAARAAPRPVRPSAVSSRATSTRSAAACSELAGVLGAEARAGAGDQCGSGHADEPRRTPPARSGRSDSGCRCATLRSPTVRRSQRTRRDRSPGRAHRRVAGRTLPDAAARSPRAGRRRSIVSAKIVPPPMTQIHSGASDAASASASSTEPARSAPSADQSELPGDHDVAAAGQRPAPRVERVPRPAAHHDGRAQRERLEVREVFGNVPRHAAVAADDPALGLRPDQPDLRSTRHTATAPRIAGWCW